MQIARDGHCQEHCSRGTRKGVFFSFELGLVTGYGQRKEHTKSGPDSGTRDMTVDWAGIPRLGRNGRNNGKRDRTRRTRKKPLARQGLEASWPVANATARGKSVKEG